MSLLENQTILIISPQPWDHLPISKHHYAMELAERGNRVFFLEPPDAPSDSRVSVRRANTDGRVSVVSYRPLFPFVIRFHARPLYDRMIAWQIRAITDAIGEAIDVVWSFDFNLFSDLRLIGAKRAIFHPVDPLSQPHQVNVARSADAVFSVSEKILSNFRHLNVPAWFINHGLSRPFENVARNPVRNGTRHEKYKVGYSGNLVRPAVNQDVLRAMIRQNPDVEFHFWGKNTAESDSPAKGVAFIEQLRSQPNVHLHGAVTPSQLASELQQMDCNILTYAEDPRESDRSNSHKILEYLSTGKVVVSSRISTYESREDLLRMSRREDDSDLPELLHDTLGRLDEFNSERLEQKRRDFALDNTYQKQITRIEEKLSR